MYTILCKCFWSGKCVYYIPLMTILFAIHINQLWVYPNVGAFQNLFFFITCHNDWPFTKKSNTFNVPFIKVFTTNKGFLKCLSLVQVYKIQAHTFGQRIQTNHGVIPMHILECILGACCPTSWLELNFHSYLCSSTFLAQAFIKIWVPIVI